MQHSGQDPQNEFQQIHKSHRRLYVIGLIVIGLLLINFTYQVWHRYYQQKKQLTQQEKCDLHSGACQVNLPNGQRVSFSIEPKTIPHNKPADFAIRLKKIQPKKVLLSIIPLDHNAVPAQHLELKSNKNNHYRANTTLNNTDADNQHWLAIVLIETPDENFAIPYKFSTAPK